MKKNHGLTQVLAIVLMIFFLGAFVPQAVFATPPATVELKYSIQSQILSVMITHDTALKNNHYIKFVEIKKNGIVVSINNYDSQPTREVFVYRYRIPAIEEDTFQAVVNCNLWGSKTSALLTVTP